MSSRLLLLAAALAIAVSAARAAPRKASPEHARLAALCGTRDVEVTFWFDPAGPGVTSKGRSTIRPLFDGLFIEETIEGTLTGKPFTSLSWTGFNPFTRRYEATRIASTNVIQIHEAGVWDEVAGQFDLKAEYPFAGETWRQRSVVRPLPDGSMIVDVYMGHGAAPDWKGVQIRYARPRRR